MAKIAQRDSVRYTPAGIAVISACLWHRSRQMEAGTARQVEFEIPALVIGELTEKFEKLTTGTFYLFTGFMATKSLKSKSLLFHITAFSSMD